MLLLVWGGKVLAIERF